MTFEFSTANCLSLDTLQKGSKIHVIGVCGVAMAQLAVALAEQGFAVSGSDKEYYEPMAGLLKKSAVRTFLGFNQSNIADDVSLVVIGNAISRNNLEVEEIIKRKISYTIFPKVAGDILIGGRTSIVITGTHGKSTTTSIGAHVLQESGCHPSYFIGGIVKGFERSLVVGTGIVSIIEGDEYDSAFFAKVPKFTFYKPKIAVITSVEYDHADIYANLEAVEKEFEKLVRLVPTDGLICVCLDDENILKLLPQWKSVAVAPILSYGFNKKADIVIADQSYQDGMQCFTVQIENEKAEIELPLLGKHNARNAAGLYQALRKAGLTCEEIKSGMKSFLGIKRRQDVRFRNESIVLIEDFAHHPTAVRETLDALAQGYPTRRIVCAFEPRSNTSRRKVFEKEYGDAFKAASSVYLKSVTARHNDSDVALMDIHIVADAITKNGSSAHLFESTEVLFESLKQEAMSGTLLVVMSNGSFDGLIKMCQR